MITAAMALAASGLKVTKGGSYVLKFTIGGLTTTLTISTVSRQT